MYRFGEPGASESSIGLVIIPTEIQVSIGVIAAILGIAGFLALRGWLVRLAVLIIGLFLAAYFLDLLAPYGLDAPTRIG